MYVQYVEWLSFYCAGALRPRYFVIRRSRCSVTSALRWPDAICLSFVPTTPLYSPLPFLFFMVGRVGRGREKGRELLFGVVALWDENEPEISSFFLISRDREPRVTPAKELSACLLDQLALDLIRKKSVSNKNSNFNVLSLFNTVVQRLSI